MTFDQSILRAYEQDLITEETARLFASRKGKITRGVDLIQKARGIDADLDSGCVSTFPKTHFVNLCSANRNTKATFFDLGDNTALVCVDHQQYQKVVVPQLIDMTYKVHLGLFEEDVLLKLRLTITTWSSFPKISRAQLWQTNPILAELTRRPDTQRRQHFVVLLSQRFATNDAMSAFVHSVDQVVNITDLANLKPVLRRA